MKEIIIRIFIVVIMATIPVLSSTGGAEPMLRSHLSICLNVSLTPAQLNEFVDVIKSSLAAACY